MALSRNHESSFRTRITALVLLLAFVLQSAASASQGCIARAFSGSCCCVDAHASTSLEAEPVRSCCAAVHVDESASDGPRIEKTRACQCDATGLPSVPKCAPVPDSAAERDLQRALHAPTLPAVTCEIAAQYTLFVAARVLRPPDRTRTNPRQFSTQRDNSERMSRLCVCLR